MPLVRIQNGSIYYESHGAGEPIVLLRGLSRSIRHWLGFDRLLAEGYRVITLDHRGIGRSSQKARARDSIYTLADDVMAVLTELDLESAHILGVSLGGMVALACGIRHPHRCRSLIVINSSIAGTGTMRLTWPAIKVITQGRLWAKRRFHRHLAEHLVGPNASAERIQRLFEQFMEIDHIEPMNTRTTGLQLGYAAKFRAGRALREMHVPTLVMYGTGDRFVPPKNSQQIFRRLPNAKAVTVEGGGHELTTDSPGAVLAIIHTWISERTDNPHRPERPKESAPVGAAS